MSGEPARGYLSRLVTRMADEPAIRPRVASRFEAMGGARDIDTDSATYESAETALDEPRIARPIPGSRPTRPALAIDRGPADVPPPGITAVVRRLTEGNTPTANDRVANAAPGPRAATLPGLDKAASPGRSGDSRPPASSDPAHPADRDPRQASVSPVARASQVATGMESAPAAPTRRLRLAATASRGDAGRVERHEPDVVQVHIGRIEVRAIGAVPANPAPVVRRTDAPRPLALDRYLAGERRS